MKIQNISTRPATLPTRSTPWRTQFTFRGKTHWYNRIAYNNYAERAVEVPLAFDFLAMQQQDGSVLEVGNVLQHYENALSDTLGIRSRNILDKFELGNGIENRDLMEIDSEKKYQTIVSISTVEHVGQNVHPAGLFGESSKTTDREAPLKAIAKIYDLLSPGGHGLLTVPFGVLTDGGWYIQFSSDYLDLLTTNYGLPLEAISIGFLKYVAREPNLGNPCQLWVEATVEELSMVKYDTMRGGARAIAVIELTKLSHPFSLNLAVPPTPLPYLGPPLTQGLFFTTGVLLKRLKRDEMPQ